MTLKFTLLALLIFPILGFNQSHIDTLTLHGKVLEMKTIEMSEWEPHRLIQVSMQNGDAPIEFYLISASLGNNVFQIGEGLNCLCIRGEYTLQLTELQAEDSGQRKQQSVRNFVSHFVEFGEDGAVGFLEIPDGKPSWMDLTESHFLIYNHRVYLIEEVTPKQTYARHYEVQLRKKCPCRPQIQWDDKDGN